jgi:hypothetical protein
MRAAAALLAAALAAAALAGAEEKPKKPSLDLRASPRFAFSPASIFFTAELKGGDDTEEYYCPEIEWNWDDGGKSVHEADCPPFEPGTTIERRFTATHDYRRAGSYTVVVTFRRAGRSFLQQKVKVTVRPGLGDPSGR